MSDETGSTAADPNASSTEDSPQYVAKQDFEKLHQQFSEFTDLVTQNLLKGNTMRDQPTPQAPTLNTGDQSQPAVISDEDVEQYGFEPKQVKFMTSLVQKVANDVAQKVSKDTLTQSDAQKFKEQERARLDNEAYSEFPELKDRNSELYKLTLQLTDEARRLNPENDQKPDLILFSALRADKLLKKRAESKIIPQQNETYRPRFDSFSLEVGGMSGGSLNNKKEEVLSDTRKTIRGLLGG